MNTPHQPSVRYRSAPPIQTPVYLGSPQLVSYGHRPILHLNPDVAVRKLFSKANSDQGSVGGRSLGSPKKGHSI